MREECYHHQSNRSGESNRLSENRPAQTSSSNRFPTVLIITAFEELASKIEYDLQIRHRFNTVHLHHLSRAGETIDSCCPSIILVDESAEGSVGNLMEKYDIPIVMMTRDKTRLFFYSQFTGNRAVSQTAPTKRISEHVYLAHASRQLIEKSEYSTTCN